MLVLLFGAALALDLSISSTRGQNLQNAADAAALAGAQALRSDDIANAGLDEAARAAALDAAQQSARDAVNAILAQNGVDIGSVQVNVEFPNPEDAQEVQVSLSDPDNGQLLSGVTGSDSAVVRSATASFESCAIFCSNPINIDNPIGGIQGAGTGDGWIPIIVGHKTYALNHHDNQGRIICVDSQEQDNCWDEGFRSAYPGGAGTVFTPLIVDAVVHDEVIYWVAVQDGWSRVFCWQTTTDTPCANDFPISRLDGAAIRTIIIPHTGGSNAWWEQSAGGLTLHDGLMYAFSHDHRVHCIVPGSTMTTCSGYGSEGNDADLANLGFPTNDYDVVPNTGGERVSPTVDEASGHIYWQTEIRFPVVADVVSGATVSESSDPDDPWVQVDLGGELPLHSVRLTTATPLTDYCIFSADWDISGEAWQNLADFAIHPDVTAICDAGTYEQADRDENVCWESPGANINRRNQDIETCVLEIPNLHTIGQFVKVVNRNDTAPVLLDQVEVFAYQGVSNLPDNSYLPGIWLQCWDTDADGPCIDFDSVHVTNQVNRTFGRPFLQRRALADLNNGPADVTAVCVFVHYPIDVPCFDHNTGAAEGSMDVLAQAVRDGQIQDGRGFSFMGDVAEIPEFNRMYVPMFMSGGVVCWDFTTGHCGSLSTVTALGLNTEDYGYARQGECLYALGDLAYFYSFDAFDITKPCNTATSNTDIQPCPCGGVLQWGIAEFDVDREEYARFQITIYNAAGRVYPPVSSGVEFHDLLNDSGADYTGTTIDMTDFPILSIDDVLTVEVFVETDGNPQELADQEVFINFGERPHLTD